MQKTLFDVPASEQPADERYSEKKRPRADQQLQAITVLQPNASLLACGAQWLHVSEMKLSAEMDVAILAKWPAPHEMKHLCRKHQQLLNEYGYKRYADLPEHAFVAVGQVLSRKKIPASTIDKPFWDAIRDQLHLVPRVEKGLYAYRLSCRSIPLVPFETPYSTFRVFKSQLHIR